MCYLVIYFHNTPQRNAIFSLPKHPMNMFSYTRSAGKRFFLIQSLKPASRVTRNETLSLIMGFFCKEEGRYRVVRGMPVTVHSMSLLSLFAVILRCCAPQPPRAFRFLRDRYTQRGLDRTDAMAQNGSAGIINQGLNGSFKCILYLTQPMVLHRIADERIFVPCYLPSYAGSVPGPRIRVNIIIVLTLSSSYLDTSGDVTVHVQGMQLFIIQTTTR